MRIGLLHPGAMGAFVGSGLTAAGHEVLWAGDGRSPETAARAAGGGFSDVGTVDALVRASEVVVSVCPPGSALEVGRSVADAGFDGPYLDLNADSPATVRAIAALLPGTVDGGIVGGPSTEDAVVHLAGPGADVAAGLLDPAVVRTNVLAGPVGQASALKAAFASSTKAVSALLLAARAAAAEAGVEDELVAEWRRSVPETLSRVDRAMATIGAKAWRFGDEMREAGAFFAEVGLPDGFSVAAGEVHDRLASLRGRPYEPAEVLALLRRAEP